MMIIIIKGDDDNHERNKGAAITYDYDDHGPKKKRN